MAMFVHLTSAANVPRIRRSGIRAVSDGRGGGRGVYCFPVLPSYPMTHQWLREMARFGRPRGLVAVHVRLPDDEPVTVGRFSEAPPNGPLATTAADAVRRVRELADARGWEVFVPRAIAKREVHRVRTVPQVAGWRYFPDSHGRRPCTCPVCLRRGEYGGQRLRDRLRTPDDWPVTIPVPVLLGRIEAARRTDDTAALCLALGELSRRRRGPVELLAALVSHPDPAVRLALARVLRRWRTPGAAELLAGFSQDPDDDVREVATDLD